MNVKLGWILAGSLMMGSNGGTCLVPGNPQRLVIDAVKYMEAHPDLTSYNKWKQVANAGGFTMTQLAEAGSECI